MYKERNGLALIDGLARELITSEGGRQRGGNHGI